MTPETRELIRKVALIGLINSDEWHQALANLQDHIGVDEGGFADIYFTDYEIEWEDNISYVERVEIIYTYVEREVSE